MPDNHFAPKLTDKDIKSFQELYKKHFGEELEWQDAYQKASALVTMVHHVYKPISVEDYKKFRELRLAQGENKPTGKKWVLRFRAVDKDKFDEVKNGLKTVETRAATPKYRQIQMGDTLVITCDKEKVEKLVNYAWVFNDVDDMAKVIELKAILPSASSWKEAKRVYDGFPGYKQKIKQHGIVAFELATLPEKSE